MNTTVGVVGGGVVRQGALQWGAVQCSTVGCSAMQCRKVGSSVGILVQCGDVQCTYTMLKKR